MAESDRIYYVGAYLSMNSSLALGSPFKKLHATIAYSRTWFPYKPNRNIFPLFVCPPAIRVGPFEYRSEPFTLDIFGTSHVLRFENTLLKARHEELIKAGATWDYPDFKAHVTIPAPIDVSEIHSITFLEEYYRTWDSSAPEEKD